MEIKIKSEAIHIESNIAIKTKENNRPPELKDKMKKIGWKPNTNLITGHWESDFVDAFENSFFIENDIKFTNNYRIVCSPDNHWKRFFN